MSCHNTELPRLALGGRPYKTSQASRNLRSYFYYDEDGKKKKRERKKEGEMGTQGSDRMHVAKGQRGMRNIYI